MSRRPVFADTQPAMTFDPPESTVGIHHGSHTHKSPVAFPFALQHKPPLRIECLKPLYTMRTSYNHPCEPKLLKLSLPRL